MEEIITKTSIRSTHLEKYSVTLTGYSLDPKKAKQEAERLLKKRISEKWLQK